MMKACFPIPVQTALLFQKASLPNHNAKPFQDAQKRMSSNQLGEFTGVMG